MGRLGGRALSTCILAVILGGTSAAGATQVAMATPPVAQQASALSPNPSPTTNFLYGVSADSATHAWAVGYYLTTSNIYDTLILRWNGFSWSQVKSPDPSSDINQLSGVSAVSSTEAWAVGEYANTATGNTETLILHWTGARWLRVNSPNPSSSVNQLFSVSAVSSTDAWAVGQYFRDAAGSYDTFVLHWDGTSWSRVKSPNPSSAANTLASVSADSSGDTWAVGNDCVSLCSTTPVYDTLILHWNGAAWSLVKSRNPSTSFNTLGGVSATSASDAWAVGYDHSDATGAYRTLIMHWNGTRWSGAASPNPSATANFLYGVNADSSTDAWAVGNSCMSHCSGEAVYDTLILHWDGTSWSRVKSPSPSSYPPGDFLYGVNADSSTDAWAVGWYRDQTGSADDTLILHWDGTSWFVV